MRVKWKKLIIKLTIWLFVEILLNFLGLDTLADYSEYLFEKHLIDLQQSNLSIGDLILTIPVNRSSNYQKSRFLKSNVVRLTRNSQQHRRQAAAYKGRRFQHKFKTYTGEKLYGIQVIRRLAGTVIPTVLPWAGVCAVYGLVVSLLQYWQVLGFLVDNQAISNAVVGLNLALTLLLAFRTNTAHDRFWEGRKLWGAMVNEVRNLTRGIWIYIQEEGIQEHREKEATMRLVTAFSTSMKLHLRQERPNSEVEALVSPQQYAQLQQANHAPLELSLWIGNYLQDRYHDDKLNVFQLTDLQNSTDELVNILGNCERILKTPAPLIYTIAFKTLLVTYFLVSPLGFVSGLGWGTGLVVGFISFVYLAIDEVGAEIEEPFGHDPNDLPLDFICDTIQGNVEDLIKHAPNLPKIIDLPNPHKKAA